MNVEDEISDNAVDRLFDLIPVLSSLSGWERDNAEELCRELIAVEI